MFIFEELHFIKLQQDLLIKNQIMSILQIIFKLVNKTKQSVKINEQTIQICVKQSETNLRFFQSAHFTFRQGPDLPQSRVFLHAHHSSSIGFLKLFYFHTLTPTCNINPDKQCHGSLIRFALSNLTKPKQNECTPSYSIQTKRCKLNYIIFLNSAMSWNNHLQQHQAQQPQQYQQSYQSDQYSQSSNQMPKYSHDQDTLSFSSDSSRGYIDEPVNSWPAWSTETSPENQAVPSQINNFNMDMYSRQPIQWNPQMQQQPITIPQQPQFFTRTQVQVPPPSFSRNGKNHK